MALGVELRLLTTAEGGRSKAIGVADDYEDFDYRPNWGLPWMSHAEQTGAPVLCFESFPVQLAVTVRAVLVPLYPQMLPEWKRVAVGDELRMYEGARVCGIATVEWIAPTDNRVSEDDRARFCAWARRDGAAPLS